MKATFKQRLKSKTYWVNVVSCLIAVVFANLPQLSSMFGEYYTQAFLILASANIILREATEVPLSEK